MTDRSLRDLFDDAVRDQPDGPPLESVVDADLARGHRRRRRRRTRVASGIGALAVVAAVTMIAPNLVSSDSRDIDPAEKVEPNSGMLTEEMWSAVESALPADVEMTGDPYRSDVPGEPEMLGPVVGVDLTRHGMAFELMVAVQPAYPKAGRPQAPCEHPHYEAYIQSGGGCSFGGYGAARGWQFVASGAQEVLLDNVAAIEHDAASVLTNWTIHPTPSQQPRPVLTNEEALAITEAVWKVAAAYPPEDLVSGIMSPGGVRAGQDEIIAALEGALGIPLESQEVDDAFSGVKNHRSFSFLMSLSGPDGEQVEVEIWQQDRMTDVHCLEADAGQQALCIDLPGSGGADGRASRPDAPARAVATSIGLRGGIDVAISGASEEVAQRLQAAMNEAVAVIPTL